MSAKLDPRLSGEGHFFAGKSACDTISSRGGGPCVHLILGDHFD